MSSSSCGDSQNPDTSKTTGSGNPSMTSTPGESVIVLPVKKRDNILTGKAISFTIGKQVNIKASSDDKWVDMFIAKSYTQLQAIYKADENPNKYNYISGYNESLFKEKAAIILFIMRGSGSDNIRIDSVVKNGDEICVVFTNSVAGVEFSGTANIAYWRILLDVKQSDVIGINQLSYYSI